MKKQELTTNDACRNCDHHSKETNGGDRAAKHTCHNAPGGAGTWGHLMVTSDATSQWPLCQEANSAKKCGSAGFDRTFGGTARTTAEPQRMNNARVKVQTNQQRKTADTNQQQPTNKAPTQPPTSNNQHQPPIKNRHRKLNHNQRRGKNLQQTMHIGRI